MVYVGRDLKDNPVSTPSSNHVFYFPAGNLNCQTEAQCVQGGPQTRITALATNRKELKPQWAIERPEGSPYPTRLSLQSLQSEEASLPGKEILKFIQRRSLSNTHHIIVILRDCRHQCSAKERFLLHFQCVMGKEDEGFAADFGLTAFTVQIIDMWEWKLQHSCMHPQQVFFFLPWIALSCPKGYPGFYCEDSKSSCLSLSSNSFCPLSRRAFNFLCNCPLRGKKVFPCNSECQY